MKIAVPAVAKQTVGTRYIYADDIVYDDIRRPDVWGEVAEVPVVERKLVAKVVFDKDLNIARRARGVGKLVAYSAALGFWAPIAVGYAAAATVGNVLETLADKTGDLMDALGVKGWGVRDTYANIIAEIAK